ncbi:MAG: hypothetical protein LBE84_10865 [Planctomycetota bacterium]|jgi:hypothetical protein|nr:hypothetical protein [Planctomycetota bacterium]
MLSDAEIISALSRGLSSQPVSPDGTAEYVFELADGMRLAIHFPPGGCCLALVPVADPLPGDADAEKLGCRLLRLRLARLRRTHPMTAAWDRENGYFLFSPLRPESERECRETAARLLDEAETTRRWLEDGTREPARRATPSLFSAPFQMNRR